MVEGMNPGSSAPGDAIFLVKCADYKCLAIHGANGKWKSFYDDTDLLDVTEVVISVPLELILPFLPHSKRDRLCLTPVPAHK